VPTGPRDGGVGAKPRGQVFRCWGYCGEHAARICIVLLG